jgi:hypothetical protein
LKTLFSFLNIALDNFIFQIVFYLSMSITTVSYFSNVFQKFKVQTH